MSSLPLEQQILLMVQTAVLLALCVRMLALRLHRVYVYFFTYLFLALAQGVLLDFLSFTSTAYLYAWIATEGSILCLYALMVLETYSIILRDLPGIAVVARKYITLAVMLAILVSLLLLGLEKGPPTLMGYFLACDRAVVSSLVFFVLLSTAFLVYFPVPLNRNVVLYSIGYTVYLLTKATALLVGNVTYYWWRREINTALLVASTGCLVFWLFSLNRAGEAKTVMVGHHWEPGDEQRILSRLESINANLIQGARK